MIGERSASRPDAAGSSGVDSSAIPTDYHAPCDRRLPAWLRGLRRPSAHAGAGGGHSSAGVSVRPDRKPVGFEWVRRSRAPRSVPWSATAGWRFPREFLFASVPEVKRDQALQGLRDKRGPIRAACHALLVRPADKRVLLDPGCGDLSRGTPGARAGLVLRPCPPRRSCQPGWMFLLWCRALSGSYLVLTWPSRR
jgi:hypothetical protein